MRGRIGWEPIEDFLFETDKASSVLKLHHDTNVPKSKQKSYIYETIAAVFDMSKFDFQLGEYNAYKKGTRDLIVISDMMQHTERLSFYKVCKPFLKSSVSKCPTYKNLLKQSSSTRDYILKTSPKQPSSSIQLYFLNFRQETSRELDTSLERLWNQYLTSVGFKNLKFERQLDIE